MAKEPELVVKDILTDFFSETASFHSEIQKELQLRSLRNQRYEPEPGRPVANISQTDEPGMNALYGTGKERQTWSMLVPVDDVELTIYGTSMQSQTPDAEGKVGLGFPNPNNPYGISKYTAHQLVKLYRDSYNIYAVQGISFNHESERRSKDFATAFPNLKEWYDHLQIQQQ